MASFEALLAYAVAIGVFVLVVIGTRRLASQSALERSRGLPGGVSSWLAELNQMLQPQQASVETIARLHAEGDQEEDEGEDDPPDP